MDIENVSVQEQQEIQDYLDELDEDLLQELFGDDGGDDTYIPPALKKVIVPSFDITNEVEESRDKERLARLSNVISKFASTLTLRKVHVDIDTDNTYPTEAWSDAETITFNSSRLKNLDTIEGIASIKGLGLHEVSHILLTPRMGSNIRKWVNAQGYQRAFNALEDQRIETFMTHKFSNVNEWLTITISKFLLSNAKAYPVLFPVLTGRKYLPADLLQAIRSSYQDQVNVQELSDLVDQYTVLNLSDSSHIPIAMKIIERYHELVNAGMPADSPYHNNGGFNKIPDPHGHDHRKDNELKSSEKSKPMNKAGQEKIIDKVLAKRNQQSSKPSGNEEGEEYDKPDAQGDDGQGEGQGQGQGQPHTNSTDDNTNDDGTGVGKGNGTHDYDIKEQAQRALDKSMTKMHHELINTVKQFNGDAELSSKTVKVPPRPQRVYDQTVDARVVSGARSFARELELIKADHDPGWLRKVDLGKLNVQRYATGVEFDEAFDQWDLGREDAVDIEAVVLLDNSPSMSWTINEAYDSMWAIKRALDKINASTTVLTFSDTHEVLYSNDERASHRKRYAGTGGGTEPYDALRYAKYVLANSDKAIKIIIAITDGQWYDGDKSNTVLRELRRSGVITALAYVDDREYNAKRWGNPDAPLPKLTIDAHGCEVVEKVNDASQLFGLAKKLVKAGVSRNLS
jgi:hypothetical protein